MTQPGTPIPSSPGWWVRKDRVGVGSAQYGWETVHAIGARDSLGSGAGAYGWDTVRAIGHKPITLDAISTEYIGLVTADITTLSLTHVATAGADVFVEFCAGTQGTNAPVLSSVKYDTLDMTKIADTVPYGISELAYYRYRLHGAPSGSKTIHINGQFYANWVVARAFSFVNVGSIGAVQYTPLTNSQSLSQALTCGGGQRVLQAFAVGHLNSGLTALSGGTNHYNKPQLSVSSATADTTFAATASQVLNWIGIGTLLIP